MSYSIRPTPDVELAAECVVPAPAGPEPEPLSDETHGRVQIRKTLDVNLEEECAAERARQQQEAEPVRKRRPLWKAPWSSRLNWVRAVQGVVLLVAILCLWVYNVHMGHELKRGVRMSMTASATSEMAGIRTALICDLISSSHLPAPGQEFEHVARETIQDPRHQRDTAKDVWGQPYHYSITLGPDQKPIGFSLISAGPDGAFGTDDDVILDYKLPNP